MRISILTFGAIASVLTINSVIADTTVTSKTYVDTTRQATIPAAGTNYDENGGGVSVVTYTEDAGVLGERGIFNPATDFNFQNNTIADGHEGDLVTADIYPAIGNIYNQIQNLPETTVTYKTCYQEVNGECILWNLTDKDVYGKCRNDSDCDWMDAQCDSGMSGTCNTDTGNCYCSSR